MLEIHSLNKHYQGESGAERLDIFVDYSQQFNTSRSCLVAENGTGKSTLLLIIAGLLSANQENISFNNEPCSFQQRKLFSALASDSIVIPSFVTAKDVLALTQDIYRCDWPNDLIESLRFTPHIEKQVGSLSAGNLKKLQLINAFMRKPKLLLLDEPNIALDEQALSAFWSALEAFSGQIIVASNDPQLYLARGFVEVPLHSEQCSA